MEIQKLTTFRANPRRSRRVQLTLSFFQFTLYPGVQGRFEEIDLERDRVALADRILVDAVRQPGPSARRGHQLLPFAKIKYVACWPLFLDFCDFLWKDRQTLSEKF